MGTILIFSHFNISYIYFGRFKNDFEKGGIGVNLMKVHYGEIVGG